MSQRCVYTYDMGTPVDRQSPPQASKPTSSGSQIKVLGEGLVGTAFWARARCTLQEGRPRVLQLCHEGGQGDHDVGSTKAQVADAGANPAGTSSSDRRRAESRTPVSAAPTCISHRCSV